MTAPGGTPAGSVGDVAQHAALIDYIAVLRLPFLLASILPFSAGAVLAPGRLHPWLFFWGLLAAAAVHLGANLLNDYADSRSGADWQDLRQFVFFGGSKLIQRQVFTENAVLRMAQGWFGIAAVCVGMLCVLRHSVLPLTAAIVIAALAWNYSSGPGKLVYRYWGEPVIFLLFGPALVSGGYYLQSGVFPDPVALAVSVPLGLLVTAILFINEIPDYPQDKAAGKLTWVDMTGQADAYKLYLAIQAAAFIGVIACAAAGYLDQRTVLFLAAVPAVRRAAHIVQHRYADKTACVGASRLTIGIFFIGGMLVGWGAMR